MGDDYQLLLHAVPPVEHRPKTYSSLILKVVRPLEPHPRIVDQREVAEVVALALREVPREVHHLEYQLAARAQPTMRLAEETRHPVQRAEVRQRVTDIDDSIVIPWQLANGEHIPTEHFNPLLLRLGYQAIAYIDGRNLQPFRAQVGRQIPRGCPHVQHAVHSPELSIKKLPLHPRERENGIILLGYGVVEVLDINSFFHSSPLTLPLQVYGK